MDTILPLEHNDGPLNTIMSKLIGTVKYVINFEKNGEIRQ